jgi:thymidylate synthase (FAD)
MKVELLEYTPNPEKLISAAAKLCYSQVGIDDIMEDLTPDKIDKFLNMLMELGHESPIEHVSFTFGVEGVSRITEQQLTRHRIASYSIQSGRYVKRDHLEYVIPPAIESNEEAKNAYIAQMKSAEDTYNWIVTLLEDDYAVQYFKENDIEYEHVNCLPYNYLQHLSQDNKKLLKVVQDIEKKAIEDARYAYPQGLATKLIFTMNARELLHLLNHRECERAQWEIRELATEIIKLVKPIAPILFKYAGAPCRRGPCPEGKMSCSHPKKI